MQRDPIVANPANGADYNKFSYVRNRPLRLVDPTGFEPEEPDPECDDGCGPDGAGEEEGTTGGTDDGGGDAPDPVDPELPPPDVPQDDGPGQDTGDTGGDDGEFWEFDDDGGTGGDTGSEDSWALSAWKSVREHLPEPSPENIAIAASVPIGLFGGPMAAGMVLHGSVAAKAKTAMEAAEIGQDIIEAVDDLTPNKNPATKRRVKLRKWVREEIERRQPRNPMGEMIDPNTRQPLEKGKIDTGHKPGNEWRRRKTMHHQRGSTRKEVLDTENNPDLYHFEDRSSNRSHKHEKK